jgi:hypothetical protein
MFMINENTGQSLVSNHAEIHMSKHRPEEGTLIGATQIRLTN